VSSITSTKVEIHLLTVLARELDGRLDLLAGLVCPPSGTIPVDIFSLEVGTLSLLRAHVDRGSAFMRSTVRSSGM
jgi:hypothetical protein